MASKETVETGEVMAWLICGVNARASITTIEQQDRRDVPPDGCLHSHSSKVMGVVWHHRCRQCQTTNVERCDVEGMMVQADVLRAHSQGVNGAELGLATGNVQCMTRRVSDQGRTRRWQSSAGAQGAAHQLARRPAW